MEISRQADYAIRTMEFLARVPRNELIQTREIARRQDIPAKYLPTIVRTLARAGLVKTLRGSNGGIRLALPPDRITLRDVVEAIDGPVIFNRCELKPGECDKGDAEHCALHAFWENITNEVQRELESVRMSDLISGGAKVADITSFSDGRASSE